MTRNLSYHANYDRLDRLEFIVEHIGVGEEFCTCPHKDDPSKEEMLTTTGILVVRNVKTHIIITMYPCSVDKAVAVYKKAMRYNNARLPQSMVHKIKINAKIQKQYGF